MNEQQAEKRQQEIGELRRIARRTGEDVTSLITEENEVHKILVGYADARYLQMTPDERRKSNPMIASYSDYSDEDLSQWFDSLGEIGRQRKEFALSLVKNGLQ